MLKEIFVFSGRLNRKPYWIRTFLIIVGLFVPAILVGVLAASQLPIFAVGAIGLVMAIPFLLALVASVSISIRRFHDRDKGWGWFAFLYGLPAVLQGFAATMLDTDPVAIGLNTAGGVLSLWALIELGVLRGTQGANSYGPDPLTGDTVDARAFD